MASVVQPSSMGGLPQTSAGASSVCLMGHNNIPGDSGDGLRRYAVVGMAMGENYLLQFGGAPVDMVEVT